MGTHTDRPFRSPSNANWGFMEIFNCTLPLSIAIDYINVFSIRLSNYDAPKKIIDGRRGLVLHKRSIQLSSSSGICSFRFCMPFSAKNSTTKPMLREDRERERMLVCLSLSYVVVQLIKHNEFSRLFLLLTPVFFLSDQPHLFCCIEEKNLEEGKFETDINSFRN